MNNMKSNFLIKREQSQACLSYAECEKSRLKAKILSLLVLLLTAATGAWAEEEVLLTTITPTSITTYSQSPDGIVTVTISGIDAYNSNYGWYYGGSVTVEAAQGYTITRCVFKQGSKKPLVDNLAPFTATFVPDLDGGLPYVSVETSDGPAGNFAMNGITSIDVYGYAGTLAPDVEVTTNAASEGATFTEASFQMPAFDATAEYELVRDMSVQMQAQVGDDPAKQPRYRVQWNGENWVPADMTQQQVAALFSVNDLVENTTLDPKNYFVSIYAVNEQGETTGDPMTFLNFTFAPGRYCVTASAMLGSPTYEGETDNSNIFELFQGFEVQVAANSFATYYKDEALTIDESTAEDAALYTISEVTATEAVLSDEIEAAPKNTPLLIFNSSDKAKTIMLIPTNEPNLALTVAPEFKGTVTAKTFSEADMEAANFYVLTDANAFVWVKGAGQIAANKCWLQIKKTAPNNTRAIVFDNDATSINEELRVKNEESAGAVFDLSGRKVANGKWLNGKLPNGVYIINGKKMVVK